MNTGHVDCTGSVAVALRAFPLRGPLMRTTDSPADGRPTSLTLPRARPGALAA